jgi:ABC-type sugar transport system substrate-binding protein
MKGRFEKAVLVIVFAFPLASVVGCTVGTGSPKKIEPRLKRGEEAVVGFVLPRKTEDFTAMEGPILDMAERSPYDIKVEFGYGDGTCGSQASIIERMLGIEKLRVLAVYPAMDDFKPLVKAMKKAKKKRIAVLAMEIPPPGFKPTSTILSDDMGGGWMVADYVVNSLPKDTPLKIVVLDVKEPKKRKLSPIEKLMISRIKDRSKGLEDGFYPYPEKKVLERPKVENDRAAVKSFLLGKLRTDYKDVDFIMAPTDEMALGALDAVRETGAKAKVTGYGNSQEAISEISKGGPLILTVKDQPVEIGKKAMDRALAYFNGEDLGKRYDVDVAIVDIKSLPAQTAAK